MACLVQHTRLLTCKQRSTPSKDRQLAVRAISSSTTGTGFDALLDWADASGVEQRPVAVQQHPSFGRCLVATEDIGNGTVLLSVPLEQVFQSQAYDDLDMHWAADMALRLLQARHVSRQQTSSSSSSSSSSGNDPAFWVPWVDSLPQRVVTPVEFTAQEVQQLVIPSTVQAVLGARESLEGCFEVLQPELADIDCSWEDFLWAVQVLHSRCFYESTAARHMAVPGIDMCNHSYEPNATVRLVHSPAACQGLDALEEVAPVAAAAAACPSYFQLVADTSVRNLAKAGSGSSDALRLLMRPDNIQAGDQVTISYGPWPSEPLLLLFGFVPDHNPHDSLVVFSDVQHMAECWLEFMVSSEGSICSEQQQGAVGGAGGPSGAGAGAGSADSAAGGGRVAAAAAVHAVVACPVFAQLLLEQVAAAEAAAADAGGAAAQQQAGPPGFRDLTLYASSAADVRLSAALQLLQTAIEAAIEQWTGQDDVQMQQKQQLDASVKKQQLAAKVPAVVGFRLQQLLQQLETAAATAAAAAAAAAVAGLEGSSGAEQLVVVDEHISYRPSHEHRALIAAYCKSKASLARKLLIKA